MPEMATDAMEALSACVRRLRPLLEEDLSSQLERRFRLSVPSSRAGLDAGEKVLRGRLEAWLDERVRARSVLGGSSELLRGEVRRATESEMASRTMLRLVLLRQLEACGVSRPVVLTGGWSSKGYLELRGHAPGLADGDYEGLDVLLRLLFDELAVDLPGLYREAPLDRYFGLSPAMLREVVASLNADELETAWTDDTTLGWVYQFWNDPHREAIDERVGPRGKVGVHEIASKTQLFTERYMVEWLLENSVGRIALGMRRARAGGTTVGEPAWPMFVRAAANVDPAGLPARMAELRVLDPACGSGHFLAGAFDLLVPLYREEARETGTEMSDDAIADSILRNNLHGVDIDSRAVQVTAAVLYLKARRLSRSGHVPPMNLVATAFDLDGLREDDPALTSLVRALPDGQRSLGDALTQLRHASFRGSLMRFRRAKELDLFDTDATTERLERYIEQHTQADDLGVRFDGTQLAAGLRLRTLLVEGRYDVVAFNPPYLATSKIDAPPEVLAEAFGGAPDLFAAFVNRAFELCKPTGLIAFVALSNWMFLATFRGVRDRMLQGHILLLADVGKGAFRRASKLIQSAMVVAIPAPAKLAVSLGARVGSRDTITASQTTEIAQQLRDQSGYQRFEPGVFTRVEGAPLLYWLDPTFMRRYGELRKIGEVADGIGGIATTNNDRFLRAVWEVPPEEVRLALEGAQGARHLPYVKGAEGREWIEPCRWLIRTARRALELRVLLSNVRVERPDALGVAYTTIGHRFGGRLHTVPSVRDVSGASVFAGPEASIEDIVCAINRTPVRELASALNPTINFQLGDVRRLPFDPVEGADEIVRVLRQAFDDAERASELSPRFGSPGPDAWSSAQRWAQRAVDREKGEPLPKVDLEAEAPTAFHRVSHAVGIALGRFSPAGGFAPSGEHALPDGILFLGPETSSLGHPACAPLHDVWEVIGGELDGERDVAAYLRKSFFAEHKRHYEGLPIHFPLSSAKRSYVAYVCVHAFRSDTLSVLLAEHLLPEKRRVEGELADLRDARQSGAKKGAAERRFADVQKLLEELNEMIARVGELAEQGPPQADDRSPKREVDARFHFDLDDGVVVSSAVLWPLLEPQWKDPRKWWRELASAGGKKDVDWSHAAARYFPRRVRDHARTEPSLSIAHGWLWELHPSIAWTWELRLQGELGADARLDERGSDEARGAFLSAQPGLAEDIRATEARRRERHAEAGAAGPLFEQATSDQGAEDG